MVSYNHMVVFFLLLERKFYAIFCTVNSNCEIIKYCISILIYFVIRQIYFNRRKLNRLCYVMERVLHLYKREKNPVVLL